MPDDRNRHPEPLTGHSEPLTSHPERSEGSAVRGRLPEGSGVPSLDEIIDREAGGYRAGSQPPADVMWSRIEGDVAKAIQRPERRFMVTARHWSWFAAGAGIAAALVIGVAIGRRSVRSEAGAPRAESRAPSTAALAALPDSARDTQMRALTLNHFAQAEMFLTEVRADLKTGRHDPERDERSRQLLARTRLIMASDAQRTPAVAKLLEDLELVLAGIAALPDSGERRPSDVRLLDERLRVGAVLPRIRTILPSQPAMSGT